MKKIIFIIILFSVSISAQQVNDKLSSAIGFYNDHNFGTAFQIFKEIISKNNLDEQKLTYAKFYLADCLINLNQMDGAAGELESFIDQYKFSNYREAA
ncbi:MAG: tetratricopeptide repeat protein, partial [Melioribacteraceae bacterium]